MKKKEIMILIGICVIGVLMYLGFTIYNQMNQKTYIQVAYRDKVILKLDVNEDSENWVNGTYGKLKVEVKDGNWRVTEEECPNHICSSIGWVSQESYFPIVCLPNEVIVTLVD